MHPEPKPRASSIWIGTVAHRRTSPVRHAFRYRVAMLGLELSAGEAADGGPAHEDERPRRDMFPLLAVERRALVSWRRRDHFGDPSRDLAAVVRDLVQERTGNRPLGGVSLLTSPRVLGYAFNPISLYFCRDAAGTLESIVAEVTSTPWRERHCYVLAVPPQRRGSTVQRFASPKRLHVSPFLGMEQEYRWRVAAEDRRLSVAIGALTRDGAPFSAALTMTRAALAPSSAARLLVQPPLGSRGTIAAIHYEAFKLWWKGAPFHPHPCQNTPPLEAAGRCR